MVQTQNLFANSMRLDWQLIKEHGAGFSFYQCSDPNRLYYFAGAFAKEQQIPLKFICLQPNSAYAPFVGIFDLLIQHLDESSFSVEEVVIQATNYKPLQQNLTAILKGEIDKRSEMVVIDDLFFEKQAITEAMVNLFAILITKPSLIVLSDWHYASASAINLLKALATRKLAAPLMVMVSIDTQYALVNRQDDDLWEGFLDWLDDSFLLHKVPHYEYTDEIKLTPTPTFKLSSQLLAQNANLMAWPEVEALARLLLEDPQLTDANKVELRLRLAEALLFSDELNAALNELESIQVFQELITTTYDRVRLFNLLSITLAQRQSFEEAMQCAEAALDIAKQAGDGQLLAQSMFVNFYVHDKSSTPLPLLVFEQLDRELQRYNMDCSHIYVLRNYYAYLRFYEQLDSKTALKITQRGIKLAKAIGHRQGVAASYHSKGIIYSYINRYQTTFRCFAISSKIREQLGEAKEQVRMHNGIGYFNTLLEQYPEAQNQYLAAFHIARKTCDDSELFVTLYNFAWLYFCTRDYQRSVNILEHLVRICRIRQITHFPFRNLYDVFSLKGLCNIKLGVVRSAQQCLERMQRLPFKPSSTGKYLQALLKGCLLGAEGDLQQARATLEQAPAILGQVVDMDTSLLPLCSTELLEIYSRQGDWPACNALLNNSLLMCDALSLPRFTETFTLIKQQVALQQPIYTRHLPITALPEISLQLDELVRNAKQVTQLRQVQQRLHEMELISRMQSLPERLNTTQKLLEESLKLVCANFTVQVGVIYHLDGKQWQLDSQVGNTQPLKDIHNYLKKITEQRKPWVDNHFCSLGEDGKRATYDSVACLPIFINDHLYGAMILCNFNRNRYFDYQAQEILQLISRQLGSQLQLIIHQENLIKMSSTDPLTGLFNRQALLTRLDHELLLYEQHADTYQCSLAYIDLDNFKKVNDLLGHDIGDKVLQAFTRLLVESMRAGDIVARWGGDEFVVLFPNANHRDAKIIAQRLLSNLKKQHFFKAELIKWTDKPEIVANLPDLSCSIGISDCAGTDYDQLSNDWLLKQADRALYQAKAEGKGRVSVMSMHCN
ncbi:MAG: diguanylate cyclase (GGDEF)-like protein [Psychromonas sp.]|jgi:diguanylate cyclase (GGDEF)-like protein|uniref:diguanylate cyclase n=1 Tax=Psychromonas sp. TaxID=1884585 RepID=UPI0039E52079